MINRKIIIALCSVLCIFLSGCALENTKDNGNNSVNVYVKGFYLVKDTGLDGPVLDEEYYWRARDLLLSRHICEFENAEYIKENDKVYKSENGKNELLFEYENGIKSIVSANNDCLIFLSCSTASSGETEHQYNDFYKYEFGKNKITKIITGNQLPGEYRIYLKENYIIIQSDYKKEIYFYSLADDNMQVFEYDELVNNTNDSFPGDFYYVCGVHGESVYIYSTKDHSLITSALEYNGDIYEYDNRVGDIRFKSFIYNDELYNIWTDTKLEDSNPPSHYGNAEWCETKYWVSDNVFKIQLKGETAGKKEGKGIIKESENRMVGYNPISNEVYLYDFNNKTIISRDLNDGSEKIIDTLKEAETIQFEWIDTKLYWVYINGGTEEYGGCHEFN